jgi:hypothetical protein
MASIYALSSAWFALRANPFAQFSTQKVDVFKVTIYLLDLSSHMIEQIGPNPIPYTLNTNP